MLFDDGPRPAMTPEEFRLLSEIVYEHCGILFREDMRYLMERRLWPRLKANALGDFTAYHRLLKFNAQVGELEAAVEALATNETYFFREPLQLRAFSEELLPRLAEARGRQRRLRIWSAGCSTGEEAYTIAMLVKESGLLEGWDVEVLGSDISRKVLAVARKATYQRNAMRETSAARLARFFEQEEAGRYTVRPEIRAMVSFGHMNLLDTQMLALLGKMDVVFCRNVMIYFDVAARRRALKGFWEKLQEGGYLLLGHAESLINVTADFELVQLEHDLVYRKPATRAAP